MLKASPAGRAMKKASAASPNLHLRDAEGLDPASPPAAAPKQKPLSSLQTYEMSDSEEENQRPKKTIPEWCQKANLHDALERRQPGNTKVAILQQHPAPVFC